MAQVLTDYQKTYISAQNAEVFVNNEAFSIGSYTVATQPVVPRNIEIVNDNVGTVISQGTLVITGTNIKGVVVSESFDLSDGISWVGTQTFVTITTIVITGLVGGVGSLMMIWSGAFVQICEGLSNLESVLISKSGTQVGKVYVIDGVDGDDTANVSTLAQDIEKNYIFGCSMSNGIRFYIEGDSPITVTWFK